MMCVFAISTSLTTSRHMWRGSLKIPHMLYICSMKNRVRAELWDKLHFILSHSNDRMIRIVLYYDGTIEIDLLTKALEHVTNSNPILHSAFRDHAMNPHWKIQPYSVDDILTVIETDYPEQAQLQFLQQVIPPESNVQFKAAVINHNRRSQLCVMINHMCVDGRSTQSFLSCLANSYTVISKGLPVPGIKSGSRAYSKIYTGFSFSNRLAARLLIKNTSQIKERRTFTYTPKHPQDTLQIISEKWTGEVFEKIRDAAKREGTTVNDLLLSFYARALYETCHFPKDRSLTITCMVDNRRYMKESELHGLTNHVGLMQVRIERCVPSVRDTLRQVSSITAREKKKRFFGLAGIPLIRLGYRLPFFMVKPGTKLWFLNPLLGFSNMGVINEGLFQLGCLKVVDGMFVGPQQYKPYLTVYIHMMCNTLYYTTAVRGNEQDRQKILQLFDTMKHQMNAFVNDQQAPNPPKEG